uniref:Agglutinin isolectin 1 n=1 Tax=Caligus clemensi TaxID=344056 RepID=C1C288_CALCM|nr:Agglutinin isolectin 1 precursor [Caligus clemensi]
MVHIWIIGCLVLPALVVGQQSSFREDSKCGDGNLAPNRKPALCQNIPPFPTCCQLNGHCGWDCDHVGGGVGSGSSPQASQPPPPPPKKVVYPPNTNTRSDGRCGAGFTLQDGVTPAECDPNSEYFCCSENNYCGSSQDHCYCEACINYRPLLLEGSVRSDRRCGKLFPLEDGSQSECNPKSANPCCSAFGYCGPGADHCSCEGCVDFRSGSFSDVTPLGEKARPDRRCGKDYPLADGTPAECDPNSSNPCCSKWGFCGPGSDHCDCPECVDYRPHSKKITDDFIGKVRNDRRCGPEFMIPGTNQPSECNPDTDNFCCSKWGFCGGDEEHCGCSECVNYRNR